MVLPELLLVRTNDDDFCTPVYDAKEIELGNSLFYTLYKPLHVKGQFIEWEILEDFDDYSQAMEYVAEDNINFINKVIEGYKGNIKP